MTSPDFIEPTASQTQSEKTRYACIQAHPISGALGAIITAANDNDTNSSSLDLAHVSDVVIDEIKTALLKHQVIVFKNQTLKPNDLVSLGSKFGRLHMNPFVKGLDDYPQIMPIKSEENHEKRFTGLWHSDISWSDKPSMGSMLYTVEIPVVGGDTLFANMYQAYETLSEGMKTLLGNLRSEHRVDRHHTAKADYAQTPTQSIYHPVICTHPETGRKSLFVNEYFTSRFENMTQAESEPLLRYLFQHSVRPDFTCRIQWAPGTLVFWDNRCTLHYATNDYPGQSRLMYRVTIDGEKPI